MNGKSQEKTYRIAIICEGQEEVMYTQSLINLGVFNPRYEIIPALATSGSDDRVGGAGNIPAFFQDYLSKPFDAVFSSSMSTPSLTKLSPALKRKLN
jgi:hypothetical protein